MNDENKADRPVNASPTANEIFNEPNPFLNETEEMHRQDLAEVLARGEDPDKILRKLSAIEQKHRDKWLPAAAPPPLDADDDRGAWIDFIGNALYFDEAVAAGVPSPGQSSEGRPFELSDLFQGIDPRGKLFFKISGHSMIGSSIKHHDLAMVDPKAEIRDGDLILANVAGLGQVVKRLRLVDGVAAALDSENPDFKPIPIHDAADLRIHGKVVWSGGIRW